MDKGSRVEITDGENGVGVCGEIFWTGDNRYGEGKRLGVRGDDGETYWVDSEHVEPSDSEDPNAIGDADGPVPNKGARVFFRYGDNEGEGTVFWVGESKAGGARLGVNDEHGETHWVDLRYVELLDEPD